MKSMVPKYKKELNQYMFEHWAIFEYIINKRLRNYHHSSSLVPMIILQQSFIYFFTTNNNMTLNYYYLFAELPLPFHNIEWWL